MHGYDVCKTLYLNGEIHGSLDNEYRPLGEAIMTINENVFDLKNPSFFQSRKRKSLWMHNYDVNEAFYLNKSS